MDVDNEIKRLRESGQIFWYNRSQKISKGTPMYHLQNITECEKGIKKRCSMVGVRAYQNNYPPEYKLDKNKCDANGWCLIIEPAFQKKIANSLNQPIEFYGFGEDVYTVGSIDEKGDYSVFKLMVR